MNFGRRRRQNERKAENERLGRLARRSSVLRAVVDDVNASNGVLSVHLEDDPDGRPLTLPPVKGSLPQPGDTIDLQVSGLDVIADPGPGALAPGRYWQSMDYVPGVSGWAVFSDGSAEFNNITARGNIDVIEGPDVAVNGGFEEPDGGAVAAGPNLVPNGTFETDASGWTFSACTGSRSTAQAHSGSASLALVATSGATMEALTEVEVEEDTDYELIVWARAATTSRTFSASVDFYDEFGVKMFFVGSAVSETDVSTGWRTGTVSLTAPVGAVIARIRCRILSPGAGGTHYFDDVVFRTPEITGDIPDWEAVSGCTVDRSAAQFHSGTASLEITSTGAGTGVAQAIPLQPVLPGEWWLLRSWNRTPQRAVVQRAQWLDADLNVLSTDSGEEAEPVPNTVWSALEDTFEAPADAAYLVPQFAVTFTGSSQVVYIDDFELHRIGTVSAKLLPRGDVPPFSQEVIDPGTTDITGTGGSFIAGTTFTYPNPGVPVSFVVEYVGNTRTTSASAINIDARIAISGTGDIADATVGRAPFNNHLGGQTRLGISAMHEFRGIPTGDIKYRLEGQKSANQTCDLRAGAMKITVMPI